MDRALLRLRLNSALEVLQKRADVAPEKIAIIGYCFGGMCAIEMAPAGSGVACAVSFHGSLDVDSKVPTVNPIKAKVLVLHGAADPFEPPAQIADFQNEMNTHGADWQMVYYANAMHGFTNKNNVSSTMTGVNYNEKADARSWHAMRDFFDEVFR
jgi:dienelactone hydrolase